jgi:hypothetical protein
VSVLRDLGGRRKVSEALRVRFSPTVDVDGEEGVAE